MGHVFQDEWWAKHPDGCSFQFIMVKGNWKSQWQRHETLIGILFMKIIENRIKRR